MDSKEIRSGRLYNDLAELWPLISPPEEYGEEASHWREVLHETLGPGRHAILELGVGGGHNLCHLTPHFDATAVDASEVMLELCRRLNPGVAPYRGDMRNVRLGKIFSAVLIHDAVSHMLTEADLLAAFATAAAHLRPGGVLVTAPDRFVETFQAPEIGYATHSDGEKTVTYFEYTYDPDPGDTTVETIMVYVVQSGGNLRMEHDRLPMGLFPKTTWVRLMNEAGFTATSRLFELTGTRRPYELLVGVLR